MTFNTYIAKPRGEMRGGAVVIVQEIFGLTPHVLRTADSYAADGYLTVAPALFDRIHRDLVLGYSPQEIEQAHGLSQADRHRQGGARYCRVGGDCTTCWQGSGNRFLLGRLARLGCGQRAAAGGRGLLLRRRASPRSCPRYPTCPTMLHFGEQDPGIPLSEVEGLRSAYPQGVYHLYAAGHAFANDDRPDHYNPQATALARSRTNAFLAQHIG